MTRKLFSPGKVLAFAAALSLVPLAALAAAGKTAPLQHPEGGFSFEGFFGKYDEASLQRGLQVYLNVCASCHGLNYVAYRSLGEPGGPGLTEEEVKALAAQYQVRAEPDEFGTVIEDGRFRMRPAEPQDHFVNPWPNEQAGRAANGGAYPPDLSLMAKARAHGPEYIYSLLQGYVEPPEGLEQPIGQYYNIYYPGSTEPYWTGEGDAPEGGFFAMPQILYEGSVVYEDGTEATIEQMSYDVTNFLMWAAEPKLEQRKQAGLSVTLFLLVLTVLMYLTYRKVWRDAH